MEADVAAGQLAKGALFFAMRSCKYVAYDLWGMADEATGAAEPLILQGPLGARCLTTVGSRPAPH